jgi:hypothetical protein
MTREEVSQSVYWQNYGLEDQGTGTGFPAEGALSFLRNAWTNSRAHSTFSRMNAGSYLSEGKGAGS